MLSIENSDSEIIVIIIIIKIIIIIIIIIVIINTFLYGAFTKVNTPYNDLHYSTGDLTRLVVSTSCNVEVYNLLKVQR